MASLSYFILGPSALLSLIGLIRGPDRTRPTPTEDYHNATIDLVIPAHNEAKNIVICLESINQQTVKPRSILLIDDGSTDNTAQLATEYAKLTGLNLTVIRNEQSVGKTPALDKAAHESDADIIFVLDADTVLRSDNYIERLKQELFQGIGIASACGVILPEFDADRDRLLNSKPVMQFAGKHPVIAEKKYKNIIQRAQIAFTNNYREELYLFLQKFIYRGEMSFFGTLINPVGCAVAYRRKYLVDILDKYKKLFGYDLTTSEDIFIGFAFTDAGFRNIQLNDVYALTVEPPLSRLPRQILMWSSAFLQSCYYFDDLVRTPLKSPRVLFRYLMSKLSGTDKTINEKRVVKEAYRQSFNPEVTKKYGRPIGWFVFTSLFEKLAYPTVLLMFIIMKLWEPLALTILAETTIYTVIIAFMHQNRRFRNLLKSILYTPVRYAVLFYDYLVILNFAKDLWITGNRRWRK